MDDEVDRLAREARLVEAAELAARHGDHARAGALFERACAWTRAADALSLGGEPARALPLAVRGGDDVLAASLLLRLTSREADAAATTLTREGAHAWAARAFERSERPGEAARAWERAGDPVRAASLLERAGDVVGASRVLEAATRRASASAEVWLALGDLLLRFGKVEPATRALQRVPPDAPERRRAVALLVRAFESLDLPRARADVEVELAQLGGPPESLPAPAGASPRGTLLFGRYERVREVASSASARVIECIDAVRGERVAVKLFAGHDARGAGRDALARFEREVRILARLDHPSLVPLRDYLPEGPALVLAWMNGGTLEERLAARSLTPARAVEIASTVLGVLGEAHRLGILHRDVKPANVLFDEAGAARLADFGVAHLGDASATATAGVIGTLAYMSPEQREGRPATAQSDVYSVGALLFEMLTGARYGLRESERLARPSAAHRDLDARHDAIVLSLLSTDPAARPADAFEARRALSALPWPDAIEPAAPRGTESSGSDHPRAGRADLHDDGTGFDRWVQRPFEHLPLDDGSLARAAAFARAGHPSLQLILRVDRDAGRLWLEPPQGGPVMIPLAPAHARDLSDALDALHAEGVVHGAIDRTHVHVDAEGRAILRFASACEPTATVDRDRLALARLAAR